MTTFTAGPAAELLPGVDADVVETSRFDQRSLARKRVLDRGDNMRFVANAARGKRACCACELQRCRKHVALAN